MYEPLFEREGMRVSKSPWGPKDEIGRLNWMTAGSRAEVLSRTDGSRVFDLAVDYFLGMPFLDRPRRPQVRHLDEPTIRADVGTTTSAAQDQPHMRHIPIRAPR